MFFFSFAVSVLQAQSEAIDIKVVRPKPGDSARFTKNKKSKADIVVGEKTKADTGEEYFVYVETIIEKPDPKKKATKLTRKYEKAELTKDGRPIPMSFVNKTVTIEKKDGAYAYTIDGKSLPGHEVALFKREFADESDSAIEDELLPGRAVQLNEEWSVDAVKAFNKKSSDNPFGFDVEKAKGGAKLVKVFDQDGHKMGTIEFTAEIPVKTMKFGPNDAKMKDGSVMSIKATLNLCIDGTSPLGSAKISIKMDFATEFPGLGAMTIKGGEEGDMKAEKVK